MLKIYVVDGDPVIRSMIETDHEPDHDVTCFENAKSCLAAIENSTPDIIMIEVMLPDMSGYELCGMIKNDPRFASTPIAFTSSNDSLDARLVGYDAGGVDFIAKPFNHDEIIRKIRVIETVLRKQRALKEQLAEGEYLTSLVMAGMDEAGLLIQFMSKLIAYSTPDEVAVGLLELLQRCGLDGVVQTRTLAGVETRSKAGVNIPLEVSVIENVRLMGRIFEFSNRSVHNFERVTLMIKNLPLDQPEYCGRLRDSLSTAAQSADERLMLIDNMNTLNNSQQVIRTALKSLSQTIAYLNEQSLKDKQESTGIIMRLHERMIETFLSFGLTETQEDRMRDVITEAVKELIELMDRGDKTQRSLRSLNKELIKHCEY